MLLGLIDIRLTIYELRNIVWIVKFEYFLTIEYVAFYFATLLLELLIANKISEGVRDNAPFLQTIKPYLLGQTRTCYILINQFWLTVSKQS